MERPLPLWAEVLLIAFFTYNAVRYAGESNWIWFAVAIVVLLLLLVGLTQRLRRADSP